MKTYEVHSGNTVHVSKIKADYISSFVEDAKQVVKFYKNGSSVSEETDVLVAVACSPALVKEI